ncbi:MAG: 3D domain-containing protein [Myxococcota bacterium]
MLDPWTLSQWVLALSIANHQLPPPAEGAPELQVWSTNYVLHLAEEVASDDGHVILAPGDEPFPRAEPIHLTAVDWCQSALQGSARVQRLDGSAVTLNYATSEGVAVDCGPPLGNARWRSQGRVRFGMAVGPWGDGVRGYQLVPYRTLATDPNVIPTGSLVYVPSARGVPIEVDGQILAHDGWFFAADVGGAIHGVHIDTFTGTERQVGLPQVTNRADRTVTAVIVPSPMLRGVMSGIHGR